MSYNPYNFSDTDSLWGYTDILTIDSELNEFNDNFAFIGTNYTSIIDDDALFTSLLNFGDEAEDDLYAEGSKEQHLYEDDRQVEGIMHLI